MGTVWNVSRSIAFERLAKLVEKNLVYAAGLGFYRVVGRPETQEPSPKTRGPKTDEPSPETRSPETDEPSPETEEPSPETKKEPSPKTKGPEIQDSPETEEPSPKTQQPSPPEWMVT